MTEKAQILHANGNKDPVAVVATSAVVKLLVAFVIVSLGTAGTVGILLWRVGAMEEKQAHENRELQDEVKRLSEKIDAGMDSRWRRSDHEKYARSVEERIRDLERKADIPPDFPFTEEKAEALTRLILQMERYAKLVEEHERWVHKHENGHSK